VSLALSVALALGVGCLVAVKWRSAVESSERRLGFVPGAGRAAIQVLVVDPELPAARAGLRTGDELVEVGGTRTVTLDDYQRAAARFVPGEPVVFRVLRGGRPRDLALVPGVAPDWFALAVEGLTTLGFLALALLALNRRAADVQA
jgi:predicted metalloprotease with PDZ domain